MTLYCDFCHAANPFPSVTFACQSFLVPDLPTASSGSWLACEPCAKLIQEDRWHELAQRAVDSLDFEIEPDAFPFVYKHMRDFHQQFRNLRLKAN
jgi:hypothetical protein